MHTVSTSFKLLAVGMAVILVAIGLIQSRVIGASENAVDRSSRYDVAWTGSVGRMEVLHLEKALTTFILTRQKSDADRVRLFGNILEGRFNIWDKNGFGAFLDQKKSRRASFNSTRAAFNDLLPVLRDPEAASDGHLRDTLASLSKLGEVVDRLGAEAQIDSVAVAERVRVELRQKQHLQSWLTMGLFGFVAMILGLMALQNRYLGMAHRMASRSADDFSHLAHHDALTGLPNRIAFTTAFDVAMKRLKSCPGREIAVLAIDLDGFKGVNDLLGHPTGDALLIAVAGRLQICLQDYEDAVVSRFGGDEFVLMLEVGGGMDEARRCTQAILDALHAPFVINGSSVSIGATIGLALSGGQPDRPSNPMLDADLALSNAKAAGKAMVLVFDPAMRLDYERRGRLETDLKEALAAGEIRPAYQVRIDLETGLVKGVEALARWHHREFGWVSPGEFVPIAESSSQIVALGRLILETACREALSFPSDISVSVNLSVGQMLRDDIVKTIQDVLAETGLPARRLTLEVTESVMITESDRTTDILRRLKALGISIALDDFGTGFSALSYLRQFDWDELKIDRSFICELETSSRSLSIVKAVLSLARELGVSVTAEGVETAAQAEFLRREGCDTGQGYLFGRPTTAEDVPVAILRALSDLQVPPLMRSADFGAGAVFEEPIRSNG